MFDTRNEAITFAQRMQHHARSNQATAVSDAELDLIMDSVIIPLFERVGVPIKHTKTPTGHALQVEYVRAIEATTDASHTTTDT